MKKHKYKYGRKWKSCIKTAELAVQEAAAAVSPEQESPAEQARKKISKDLVSVMNQQRAAVFGRPRISRNQ